MWLFLLEPSIGVLANVSWISDLFPVVKSPGLLRDPDTALMSVALSSVWAGLGFTFILITAGLQGIPRDLHEAAVVDGAGGIRRFWSVTLPLLAPTLLFVIIVLSTRAFQAYGEIDLLTDGGPRPENPTTTLTYLTYGTNSIINNNLGLQAAVAVLLFLVLLVLVGPPADRHRPASPLRVTTMTVDATTTYDSPRGWRAVGRYGLLVVVSAVVLFPVYTTLVAALKPSNKVLVHPLVPEAFTLDVFRDAWTEGQLGRFLLNSLIVATVITVGQVVTSVISAYAFAFLEFPGRNLLFVLFLATLLVPVEATLVVNRKSIDSLGWLNSYAGLTVPFLATAFGTFLLRQTFLTLPRDLRDAASIDGVGHVGFLRHVAVPLVRPTLGAMALLFFLGAYGQYLWPNLITTEFGHVHRAERAASSCADIEPGPPEPRDGRRDDRRHPIVVALLIFQRQLCAASRREPSRDEERTPGTGRLPAAAACSSGESILNAGNPPLDTTTTGHRPAASTVPGQTTTTTMARDDDDHAAGVVAAVPGGRARGRHRADPADVLVRPADRGRRPPARADGAHTTRPRTEVRVTLQNQVGYEGDDRQVRAEQPGRPPEPRPRCRSTSCSRWLTADHDHPGRRVHRGDGYDTSEFLPGALEAYRDRGRAMVDAVQRQHAGPVLQQGDVRDRRPDVARPPVSIEDLREASQAIVDSGAATVRHRPRLGRRLRRRVVPRAVVRQGRDSPTPTTATGGGAGDASALRRSEGRRAIDRRATPDHRRAWP